MATITLDQIKADVEKNYAPMVIPFGDGQSVTLTNGLRLSKEKRDEMSRLNVEWAGLDSNAEGATENMIDLLQQIVQCAATDTDAANDLLEQCGDDLPVLLTIFTQYANGTDLPEASPSPS